MTFIKKKKKREHASHKKISNEKISEEQLPLRE